MKNNNNILKQVDFDILFEFLLYNSGFTFEKPLFFNKKD